MHFNLSCYTSTDGIAAPKKVPSFTSAPTAAPPAEAGEQSTMTSYHKTKRRRHNNGKNTEALSTNSRGKQQTAVPSTAESKVSNKPRRNHDYLLKRQQGCVFESAHRRCWFFEHLFVMEVWNPRADLLQTRVTTSTRNRCRSQHAAES